MALRSAAAISTSPIPISGRSRSRTTCRAPGRSRSSRRSYRESGNITPLSGCTSTLHGVVFDILVWAPPCSAETLRCRVRLQPILLQKLTHPRDHLGAVEADAAHQLFVG